MKTKKEFVLRNIAGDTILVPLGNTALDVNGLIILNELAAFIWENLPEAADEAAIVSRILEEYEVSREEAEADTADFLAKLRELDII